MKSLYTIVAVLASVALIGSIGATSLQSVIATQAPPEPEKQFKELTKDFENAVLEAAAIRDTAEIQRLLGEYSDDVTEIFASAPPDPE